VGKSLSSTSQTTDENSQSSPNLACLHLPHPTLPIDQLLDPTPSPEDIAVTEQLVAAGQHLDIELVDHLVIGNQRFVSLKERLRW